MVSAFVSRSSSPGSSPGRGHYVVFLGKTLYSHTDSVPLSTLPKPELLGAGHIAFPLRYTEYLFITVY